jgi:hypothetical protein
MQSYFIELRLMGNSLLIISPSMILAIVLFTISGVMPLFWRNSRFSLYSSLALGSLAFSMIIVTYIYVLRYYMSNNYFSLPTINGIFYATTSYNASVGIPFFISIVFIIINSLNAITKANWIRRNAKIVRNPLKLIEQILKILEIKYTKIDETLIVDDLQICEKCSNYIRRKVYIISGDEVIIVENEAILKLKLQDGLKLLISNFIDKSNIDKISSEIEFA